MSSCHRLHKMDLLIHIFSVSFPFPKPRGFSWCLPPLVFKGLEVASLHLGPWMLAARSPLIILVLSWPCAAWSPRSQSTG